MGLFSKFDLRRILDNQNQKIREKIEKFTNDELMANDPDILADNIYQEFFIEPVEIGEEEFSEREVSQCKFEVPASFERRKVLIDGIKLSFSFPYTGEKTLFDCQASTFLVSPYPEAEITSSRIILSYHKRLSEMQSPGIKEQLLSQSLRDIEDIRQGVDYANADVSGYNSAIRPKALAMIKEKRAKVEAFYSVAKVFEIPVKKTAYASTHVPLKRRIQPISKRYSPTEHTYCINDEHYSDILSAIKHTGSTYERTPSSYAAMKEEDLRNTLLATLNATYQGSAVGEAFRCKGKTDICVEVENRAAFVAECKMWTGVKAIGEAIVQLDSYLTWRDCKTALIYFVRRKDFVSVLSAAKEALYGIEMIRQVKEIDKNEFDCWFVSKSNPGQQVKMRVMLFNMQSPEK